MARRLITEGLEAGQKVRVFRMIRTASLYSVEGKKGQNQDMVGVAISKSSEFKSNALDFLTKSIAEMRESIAKIHRESGATLNLTALLPGSKLLVANLGDSPTIICAAGGKNSFSIQLTPDHRFSDPEIKKHFPQAEEDYKGDLRCDGLVVPCAGHGRLESLTKVQPSINIFDLTQLPTTAKLFGIDSPLEKVVIMCGSDGLFDFQPSDQSNMVMPITVSYKTSFREDGKPKFSVLPINEHELSKLVINAEDPAKEAVDTAQHNDSIDDISVACIALDPALLAQPSSNSEVVVLFAFDGNGPCGHEVSKKLAQDFSRALELQPIADLPLSQPHDTGKDDPLTSPKTTDTSRLKASEQVQDLADH